MKLTSKLLFGFATALALTVEARATILFRPVGRPPEVFAYNGVTVSQPLTSNPYALNSPKVYFIFVGPNWVQNGNPSAAAISMIWAAKAILGSSYLSGLTQYGSDGHAVFGDSTIDTSLDPLTWSNTNPDGTRNTNPVWFETDRILANPAYSSWLPPAGDARTSPIYVVVRYALDGTGDTRYGQGANDFGPNGLTSRAVNVIDVSITTADQVDGFSWVFSHEIAERMSSGTGGLSEVSPDPGRQIADGEPEGSELYAWRLYGAVGPVVTSYWSVLDQAFIIPDGTVNRVLLVPVWDNISWTWKFVSLQQGNLYQLSAPDQQTLIDTQVQSYVINLVNGAPHIFDLTADGQVKEYSGSGTNWTAVTGAPTIASSLVTTSYLAPIGQNSYAITSGDLYMVASNGGPNQVWKYSGSGTNWTAVTGTNTSVSSIAAAGCSEKWTPACGSVFMLASNTVWRYSGSGTDWSQVTGTNTHVYALAAAGGSIYMMASNGGGRASVWQYSSWGTNWPPVTGTNTSVYSIVVAGDVLCMTAARDGEGVRVWQYGLMPNIWAPLTGPNTTAGQIVVQDGIGLYMKATNDNKTYQVWQYRTPNDWQALTGPNTNVYSISIGPNNSLYMIAANNGAAFHKWLYDGTPYHWTMM